MAYGGAIGTVGESTTYACDNRQLTDELAVIDRGSSTRTEIMRYNPPGHKTRVYQTD